MSPRQAVARAEPAGAGGRGSGGGGGAGLSNMFGNLVLGDGVPVPEYGNFSRAESARFYGAYEDYKGSVELGNHGQSVQRSLLSVSQLLRRNIRSSLIRRIFPKDRRELSEGKLLEALARHGECWDGDSMDPAVATAEMAKVMRMGNEPTAEDRADAVLGSMETYFENRSAEAVFRDPDGSYKRGPARVITQAFVDGLKSPGFKDKVVKQLHIREGWKSDPDMVFQVVLSAAREWRTVEHNALFHKRNAARGKAGAGAAAGSSGGAPTCWTCGTAGHKRIECKSAGKPGTGAGSGPKGSDARPQGQQQRNKKTPPAKGTTPTTRGGSQQRPAAQGAPVAGRAAVPAGEGEPGDSAVIPPAPLPDRGGALAGGASLPGVVILSLEICRS